MADEHRPALRWSDDTPKRRSKKGRRSAFVEGEDGELKKRYEPDESKLTEEALREAALRYLDKQDASVEQVRKTLRRRHQRYGADDNRMVVFERIEDVLGRLQEPRILDDERYSRGLAESLRRRGGSVPLVRQKMRARGLPAELIDQALVELEDDPNYSDEASAREYARKRRLTSRYNLEDPKERQKALAALARQGFSFDIARRALDL